MVYGMMEACAVRYCAIAYAAMPCYTMCDTGIGHSAVPRGAWYCGMGYAATMCMRPLVLTHRLCCYQVYDDFVRAANRSIPKYRPSTGIWRIIMLSSYAVPVLKRIVLQSYASFGTEMYHPAIGLHACYAICITGMSFCYGVSGTEVGYGAGTRQLAAVGEEAMREAGERMKVRDVRY